MGPLEVGLEVVLAVGLEVALEVVLEVVLEVALEVVLEVVLAVGLLEVALEVVLEVALVAVGLVLSLEVGPLPVLTSFVQFAPFPHSQTSHESLLRSLSASSSYLALLLYTLVIVAPIHESPRYLLLINLPLFSNIILSTKINPT